MLLISPRPSLENSAIAAAWCFPTASHAQGIGERPAGPRRPGVRAVAEDGRLQIALVDAQVTAGSNELAERLKEHGLEETEASITAKLNRGTFGVIFFLATMQAIGRNNIKVEGIQRSLPLMYS